MENWPNFFIVGVPKAGTTSLYQYLNEIPGIFMSQMKEPYYFTKSIKIDTNFVAHPPITDEQEYLSLFENVKDEKIVGEATPFYLFDPIAPKLINEISPNARIIISIRDPVERALSHYLPVIQARFKIGTFHEQIQVELKRLENHDFSTMGMLQCGLYFQGIKRYLDTFGKNQVKIIIFEEFIKSTKQFLEDILEFLDVDTSLSSFKPQIHNPYRVSRGQVAESLLWNPTFSKLSRKLLSESTRKFFSTQVLQKKSTKPKMDLKDKKFLIEFYKDDVQKLEELLGKKLPWKNFQ